MIKLTKRRRWAIAAAVLLPAIPALWILLPLPARLTATPEAFSLTLQDRHGLPLRTTRASDGSRTGWMPLDDIDPQILQAFIALEDRRFYRHHGIDIRAVGRAFVQAVRARRVVSGASTITMQLARLLQPGARGWAGKFSQSMWALRLEAHLSKQEILEQYLNRVPLGEATVGVGAAAALYLDATAARVSLGQAAMLAGLAGSPSSANPVRSPVAARRRQALALRRMAQLGYASQEAADRAGAEPLTPEQGGVPFIAPHFTSRVLGWVRDSGLSRAGVLRTSLDVVLQSELEAEVRHTVSLLRESEVREAAAVVLDNASGDILAWVGSPDFWADTAGQVDMVTSPRQPGSALKPFVYALAFDRGYTAATTLPDEPRTYRTATGSYQPQNYDRRFHGPVRARDALASSFNVPAVELTHRLGTGTVLRVLHEAGFALHRGADDYGLGLALGNGDVTLLELASAYRGLANGGVWRDVRWLATAREGAAATDGRRFVSRGAALLTLDVLADADARVPGFGADTPFDLPFPVAVKTGTSHHFTDNWAVGVTGNFTVAVWVGNFSGRPMRRVSGVTGAGPLLRRALLDVARRYDAGALPTPAEAGATRARVCRASGARAGAGCPFTDEWFLPGTAPAGMTIAAGALRIVSPLDGDRYEVPAGEGARYATIALRAEALPHDEPVRWLVDGRASPGRWRLARGRHAITAIGASGRTAEVSVVVR